MRYINQIFTSLPGRSMENTEAYNLFDPALDHLALDEDARSVLKSLVRYYLHGRRSRQTANCFSEDQSFAHRMQVVEDTVNKTLDCLAKQIRPALQGQAVDAIFTTSSTCNLMPGISWRLAHRLDDHINPDSLLTDLGNVGCTGSIQTLKLADSMDASFNNMLIVSIELPSMLINLNSTATDVWQGNCTFGDGAAAVWLSSSPEQGDTALRLDDIRHARQTDDTGLKLIRWTYDDFYTFRMADEKIFNEPVRHLITEVLNATPKDALAEPFWAIHPAGIALMMRAAREMGFSPDILSPTLQHYEACSNMSSASILHILKDINETVPQGARINLLTLGAGFNVMYGRVYKEL